MHLDTVMRTMSPEQLVEVISQVPVGLCVAAVPSLRIVAADQEFAGLAGFEDADHLIGQTARAVPGTLLERLLPLWEQVMQTRQPTPDVEMELPTGDGTRPFDVRVVPLKHVDGSPCALLTTTFDLTERKQVEDALSEARRQAEDAYRRERRIATRFQSALLPEQPVRVPGCAVAHTYRPALVEADVGGDFYNIFAIGSERTGIVVGDVGGKGLDAAVLAARAQHSVTALAMENGSDPGKLLTAVHRIVASDDPERLLTVFVAILEHGSGRLSWASAGHEPAFVWHAEERRAERLGPTGPAMFGGPAESYSTETTTLPIGGLLVAYTDGLPDARIPGSPDIFGDERLRLLLAACHDDVPAVLVDTLCRAAVEHSRGNLRDDIALVAIRRLREHETAGDAVFVTPP